MRQKEIVTKNALCKMLSSRLNIRLADANEYVSTMIKSISNALVQNKVVKLKRLGSFSTHQKNARIGRNPKTGEEAVIKAQKVIRFKISPVLKKRINTI